MLSAKRAAAHRQYLTETRRLRKSLGLCTRCVPGEATHGELCWRCRKAQTDYERESKDRRMAAGLCRDCANPRNGESKYCPDCKARRAKNSTEFYQRRKAKNDENQCRRLEAVK